MRKLRSIVAGATYHVMARANHKELLLEPASVKATFLAVVAAAKSRFSFHLENFVIMGNHFHFLIRPDVGSNLSSIMKWILQTFAIRYNKLTGQWGHFWGDRFASWIVAGTEAMVKAFRYIDQNPVRAGLVAKASDWEWGALWFRRRGRPSWVDEVPGWLSLAFPEHGDPN